MQALGHLTARLLLLALIVLAAANLDLQAQVKSLERDLLARPIRLPLFAQTLPQ